MRLPFCVMDKKLTFATPRVLMTITDLVQYVYDDY
jgi:hypothetical protein